MLKFNRVLEFRAQTETSTNYPYFFRIFCIYTFIVVMIHWNACIFFLLKKYFDVFVDKPEHPSERQFDLNATLASNNNDTSDVAHFLNQYTSCFYRSTLQLTTISNIDPGESSFERLYLLSNFLIGVLVFALIVGSVTEIIDDLNKKRREFQEKVDEVKNYMTLANVDKQLQKRVIKWFNHSWSNNSGMDEQVIFQEFLPENLQAEISINIHLEALKRVHIFQDCEPGLLQQLVTRLKLRVYSPGDFICKKGDIGREMYFIKSGTLSVVSDDGLKVFVNLSAGSYFGEISILDIPGSKTGNRRTANVKAVGYSDLFCLTKADLWQVLAEYPLARKALLEKGKALLRKDNLLNEDVANEAELLERRNANLETEISRVKYKLDSFNKRNHQIGEIVKNGFSLINVRINKVEKKILES